MTRLIDSKSARLQYERLHRKHAEELREVLCDPNVYVNVDDGNAPTFNELLASFVLRESSPTGSRSHETWIDYIVRIQHSCTAIGRVEATIIEYRAEVAYLLGAAYWRQGYGHESLAWLQDFLRNTYAVKEFWATVTPGNVASKQLLLKHGYSEVLSADLPLLTSYEDNDWVFFRIA